MDDYRMVDKDEVREMMGGCSDQLAYKIIRKLNRELEEKGAITVQGKVSRSYLIERMFDVHEDKDEGKCQ